MTQEQARKQKLLNELQNIPSFIEAQFRVKKLNKIARAYKQGFITDNEYLKATKELNS